MQSNLETTTKHLCVNVPLVATPTFPSVSDVLATSTAPPLERVGADGEVTTETAGGSEASFLLLV